jgi:hypothetical protein
MKTGEKPVILDSLSTKKIVKKDYNRITLIAVTLMLKRLTNQTLQKTKSNFKIRCKSG